MNGYGAIFVGLICSVVVWVVVELPEPRCARSRKVDDALGVVYTHGIAGLLGGLLVGILADPDMTEYGVGGEEPTAAAGSFSVDGLVLYGAQLPPALGAVPGRVLDHRLHGGRDLRSSSTS